MSAQRDYHVTVFGATGVTGKYVAEELHRIKQEKGHEHLRWAMAGRSLEKLKEAADGKPSNCCSFCPTNFQRY